MAFPTNPANGDRITIGNTQYEFNGIAWDVVGTVGGDAVAALTDRVTTVENNKLDTASLLTEIKKVDGLGSGLDTDLVQGTDVLLKADKVVTVGSGGDFATINEAISELSKSYPLYKPYGYNVEIRLLAGFVMQETVVVRGIDLGWITITGEDAETVIQRDAITNVVTRYGGYYAAFFGLNNATLPIIGQLFNMDTSGNDVHQHGITVMSNSKVTVLNNCGVKNAHINLSVYYGSTAVCSYGIFTGGHYGGILAYMGSNIEARNADCSLSYYGIRCMYASSMSAYGINCSDTGYIGISADQASTIEATYSTATNTGLYSVYARYNSKVDAGYSNCSTDGDPTAEYVVDAGSTISIHGASGETDTNISVNTVTSSGIIYQ
jgi:hypothetical protein